MTDTPNTSEPSASASTTAAAPQLGRNEPCHCGSGKKYKRCHGVDAAPKITPPAVVLPAEGAGALPGGFDPSKMDPVLMQQMAKSLQRLPRGQMAKLQSVMQRAMAGQDVQREAMEFEKMLPPEFQQMAMQMMMSQGMGGEAANAEPEKPMDADAAKLIVAKAVLEGKMSEEQAKELLGEDAKTIVEKSEKKGFGGLLKKMTGK